MVSMRTRLKSTLPRAMCVPTALTSSIPSATSSGCKRRDTASNRGRSAAHAAPSRKSAAVPASNAKRFLVISLMTPSFRLPLMRRAVKSRSPRARRVPPAPLPFFGSSFHDLGPIEGTASINRNSTGSRDSRNFRPSCLSAGPSTSGGSGMWTAGGRGVMDGGGIWRG